MRKLFHIHRALGVDNTAMCSNSTLVKGFAPKCVINEKNKKKEFSKSFSVQTISVHLNSRLPADASF